LKLAGRIWADDVEESHAGSRNSAEKRADTPLEFAESNMVSPVDSSRSGEHDSDDACDDDQVRFT
jgi:hypothetical protein